jgi:type VI secretion system secreted protein VgrG
VLSSAQGLHGTSERLVHLAAGDHIALSSGEHISLSVGKRLLASVREGIRYFVRQAGIRMVAVAGDIDIKALGSCLNLMAKVEITKRANQIILRAKEEILLVGGGSYIRINKDGIEYGTSGNWEALAEKHVFVGPRNFPIPDPTVPGSHLPFSECYQLKHEVSGEVMAQIFYCAETREGTRYTGRTDDEGFTTPIYTDYPEGIVFYCDRQAHLHLRQLGKTGEST